MLIVIGDLKLENFGKNSGNLLFQQKGGGVHFSWFLEVLFLGKLHTHLVGLSHDLTLHLALARGGGASLARAHWSFEVVDWS